MTTDRPVYGFEARTLDGAVRTLDIYRGRVLLVVNVASRCGFTPQYRELQALYGRNHDRGFEVLGFPCNQFGGQEPGTSADIRAFCEREYHVTFPMFERVDVRGPSAHPLFRFLTASAPGVFGSRRIKWNFTKFLIDRVGRVHRRYAPWRRPDALQAAIDTLL
jgi:glutathione peroxidase